MDCSMSGLPVHQQLPEFTQTHIHQVGDATQPSHPLSSPSPPAFIVSQHQSLFKWVSSSNQVAKVLEFSFKSVLPMNIQDWFPLGWTGWISLLSERLSRVFSKTTVTWTTVTLNHSSKASILRHSAFFRVQLSHPYMTTGETVALTWQNFVGKVMPLLFNKLSRLVITFPPRSKYLLISCSHHLQWFWSPKK